VETWPYWQMALRRVCAATFSHAKQKIAFSVTFAMIGFALQYILCLRTLGDSMQNVVILVGSVILVMVGSFLWKLIVVPASIYPEPRKRTRSEQDRLDVIEGAVQKHPRRP
jgi:hypothetical protein